MFIARRSGRALKAADLPKRSAVSITRPTGWASLMAVDDDTQSRRMDTLAGASRLEPVPVDEVVATA
ncbi:MAG: hypothetical protein R3C32_10290 [Chloroflexota bacterium]